MDIISAIPPQFHSVILLAVVMLSKYLLLYLVPHHPWHFFNFFCQQLANKVNKTEDSARQQAISGGVATIVTFAPIWLILWLFGDFVEVGFIWQGILLYLALGSMSLTRSAKTIIANLNNGNNYQAKQTLAPLVLRDTSQLSAMGIAKASIEMLVLRYIQEVVTVIFLYAIGGALLAISYRLLIEMHYAWNPKLERMKHFGSLANQLTQLITWLPSRIILVLGLLLHVGQQSTLFWRLTMPMFFKLSNQALLQFFAMALQVKLSGVAIYNGTKLRRAEFNHHGQAPEPHHISQSYQLMARINAIIVLFYASYLILLALLTGIF
ncbi:cobalamin biosynthesis protein CobD/CbiB [Colwellia sp. MEBiC06753]